MNFDNMGIKYKYICFLNVCMNFVFKGLQVSKASLELAS